MRTSLLHRRLGAATLALLFAACTSSSPAPSASAPATFSAAPAATNAGRSVTLSWSGTDGERLTLDPGGIDVSGRSGITVTPGATTTYQLTGTRADGSSDVLRTTVRIYDWTALGNTLDGFVAGSGANTVTGYSFLLFDDQGLLYSRAGGDQTIDSAKYIASASKMPSAAAILTLVDQHLLDLDTPVGTYLARDPGFVWPADKAAITLRMLLAHTSGLPGLNDSQPACLGKPTATTLRACAQDVANAPLVFPPGAEFNYGGSDYQLAGYIAALLSGEDWQSFFAARIGLPLGLTTYTYGGPTVTNPAIASGARSSAADYMQLLQLLRMKGKAGAAQVLSAAMVAEMEKDQIAGLPVGYAPFPTSRAGDYPGYGFGLFVSAPAMHPGSPGPEYSDPGLFGTTPWFDEGLRYGAVLLINDDTATGLNIWDAARPAIITQLGGS